MGMSLNEVAQQLKNSSKKVQLIYAFNGTGKTRLSREFKSLLLSDMEDDIEQQTDVFNRNILYYNAFTEDLFYWDNDLENDEELKLKIQPNNFTDWVLVRQGQDQNVIKNFQHYSDEKLTPKFNQEYITEDKQGKKITIKAFSEVAFSFQRGNDKPEDNIKISKGEESNFIWSVFYSLFEQIIDIRNVLDPIERETNQFDKLEHIFIDDPVTSLDDNHLIELAVNLASLVKSSESDIKFIITTHNPLFYNVLHNEINKKACYMLDKNDDGSFELSEKAGDSNSSFLYHLHLKKIIEQSIEDSKIEKYHFTLLRNLYEKTASFLGYKKWGELLPDDKKLYYNRIIQFTSHSSLATEVASEPTKEEKQTVKFLLQHLTNAYNFWKEPIDE